MFSDMLIFGGAEPCEGVVEAVDEGLNCGRIGVYKRGHRGEGAVADVSEFGTERDGDVSHALGYKHSGLGRENSLAAIEHYTQRKSVYVELGDVDAPF